MLSKMYTDPPENLRKFLIAHSELFAYISKYTGAVRIHVNNAHIVFSMIGYQPIITDFVFLFFLF